MGNGYAQHGAPPHAPPPPPQKSSALKWVLIGCGCLFLMVAVPVGSCAIMGVWLVGKAKEIAEAWQKVGDEYVRGNAVIRQYLGGVSTVTYAEHPEINERDRPKAEVPLSLSVTGEKGEGQVVLKVAVSTDWKPTIKGGTLIFQGKRYDLTTGKELPSETPTDVEPPPSPPPDEEDK